MRIWESLAFKLEISNFLNAEKLGGDVLGGDRIFCQSYLLDARIELERCWLFLRFSFNLLRNEFVFAGPAKGLFGALGAKIPPRGGIIGRKVCTSCYLIDSSILLRLQAGQKQHKNGCPCFHMVVRLCTEHV